MTKPSYHAHQLSRTKPHNEDDSDDCMCEVMCADDLSQVDSKDCSCDDCAEAMMEAYGEYLAEGGSRGGGKQNKKKGDTNIEMGKGRGRGKREDEGDFEEKRNIRGGSTFNRSPRFQIDKSPYQSNHPTCQRQTNHSHTHTRPHHRPRHHSLTQQQDPDDDLILQPESISISPTPYPTNSPQFLHLINTKIQQNLLHHRNKEKHEKHLKTQEELRKKLALAKLDEERKRRIGEGRRAEEGKVPWGYQLVEKEGEKEEEEEHCHKIPLKGKTDTGGDRELMQQIAKQKYQQKKQLYKQQLQQQKLKASLAANRIDLPPSPSPSPCPYDPCKPHHHPSKLINETTKKIDRNVEKHKEKLRQEKLLKEEAEKLKESKLRALAMKAQKGVERAKKVGVNERSSFHETIEHFSTFSELARGKEEMNRQKEGMKRVREQIGGAGNGGGNVHYDRQQISQIHNEEQEQIIYQPSPPKPPSKSISREKPSSNPASNITKQVKQQALKSLQQSLNRRIKPRELQQQIEAALNDPNSKYYLWDMPLNEHQIKHLFVDCKLPPPPPPALHSSSHPQAGPSDFRQQVNRKISENIKKKLNDREKEKKQNAIEEKVREKKEEIMKEYRRIRDMQTEIEGKGSSQNGTKTKSQIVGKKEKEGKEIKSEFVEKLKGNQKDRRKGKEGKEANIKGNKLTGEGPWNDLDDDEEEEYQNKAMMSLQDNEVFTTGDKKIFVLNSEMLAGVKHLKV